MISWEEPRCFWPCLTLVSPDLPPHPTHALAWPCVSVLLSSSVWCVCSVCPPLTCTGVHCEPCPVCVWAQEHSCTCSRASSRHVAFCLVFVQWEVDMAAVDRDWGKIKLEMRRGWKPFHLVRSCRISIIPFTDFCPKLINYDRTPNNTNLRKEFFFCFTISKGYFVCFVLSYFSRQICFV